MTSRKQVIQRLDRAIGTRKLVWFGTRGTDCQSLMDIPQLEEVYSLIAPMGSLSLSVDYCLETKSRRRVNLDTYTIDEDFSDCARDLIMTLRSSLSRPSVLTMYRPSKFFTSLYYTRQQFTQYLGMFHEFQQAFEHKPWVECELKRAGIKTLSWEYFGDDESNRLTDFLHRHRTIVLRSSKSDGGTGLAYVESENALRELSPKHGDWFISASPFVHESIPLNVNAVVFPDSTVSVHAPSIQFIGVLGCTDLRFGYCGNDFGSVSRLSRNVLDNFDALTRRVGMWLSSKGFVGAFGIDALTDGKEVLLTEINPRFQGSSHRGAMLDCGMDRPDMFLQHLAAHFGHECNDRATITDLARAQEATAQLVFHQIDDSRQADALRQQLSYSNAEWEIVPRGGIEIERGAITGRLLATNITINTLTSWCENPWEAIRPEAIPCN